jgi:phosphopantetheine adenylyltransferase
MSGIKHLSEIYKKQGSAFLDDLFSREVIVSEKLNGMSFSFEKSFFDGTIYFYKRDQNTPISKIDRVLMKYYENPISFINTLSPIVLDEIPSGWRFGMEFFINQSPVSISYNKLPKNSLVLTHIVVKNEYGDVEKTIVEKEELEYWSDLIGVESAPIIFQGKLDDEQKNKINDFINSPYDSLKQEHGTYSFARYILGVLNPSLSSTFLNDTLDDVIEGVVFRFGSIDGTGESFTAKILDPMFEDITKQNNINKNSYFPSDIYGITVLEVMNFILDKGIDSFTFEGEEPHERYISYISSVFNNFIDENGEKYLGLDFQEPEFLKQPGFDANIDLIKNERTKQLVSEESSYQSLFKLILSAFRKIKKKQGGFFTKGAIEQFNLLVKEISELLNDIIVIEAAMPSFDQFRKKKIPVKSDPLIIPEEDEDEDDEKDDIKNYQNIEDEIPVEIIVEPKEANLDTEEEKYEDPGVDQNIADKMKKILGQEDLSSADQEGEDVNLVIGKFHPFNLGHYKLVKKAHDHNKLPVSIFVVPSNKEFLDSETMKKMMDLISHELSDEVASVNFIENDLLSTAIDNLDSKYKPKTLTVGQKRTDNYKLQTKSLKKRKRIPKDFQLQTSPDWLSSSVVNKSIQDKDYLNFKKNVPKSIHGLWDEILRSFDNKKDI